MSGEMTMLLVDDKPQNRSFLESLLRGQGHRVETAGNGAEALAKLRASEFDLVVSDVLMPVMDGYQLCHHLREDPELCGIPFIVYSATYTDPEDEELAIKAGADRFVRKPCEPDELLQIIDDVLEPRHTGPRLKPEKSEVEVLKLYNERLVSKLGAKMVELEEEIQQRRKAEADLKTANLRLQLALKSANIGLWDWDLETDELWLSPDWRRRMLGEAHRETYSYADWLARIHEDDRPSALEKRNACRRGDRAVLHDEFRVLDKDGAYRWIAAEAKVLPDVDGQPRRVTGCFVDVTRHRAAVQALEVEKKKFQVLVDESPLGIVLLARDGRVLYLNPRFTEIFGYDLSSIPTRADWADKAYPDREARAQADLAWSEIASSEPHLARLRSALVVCADGTEKLASLRVSLIPTGEIVIVCEDVTEKRQLEEQLRQSQKMEAVATLAGGIAHDFNNILGAVMGHSELGLTRVSETDPVFHDLRSILAAATRAQELTRQILTFSRRTEKGRKAVDLRAVIEEALGLLRPGIPQTVEIRFESGTIGKIMANPGQMHQVIMNLCTNAYQAMRDTGGVLEVRLDQVDAAPSIAQTGLEGVPSEEGFVRLSVSDTGCGIPEELRVRIFDPYFTTKGEHEGTGLGLAVVHGIVKDHGGTITVDSQPGRGSVFRVYFPAKTPVDFEEPTPKEDLPTRGSARILFVDDEPALAHLGKGMLEAVGYEVESFSVPGQALERFLKEPDRFDLVVTDMNMPGMTGVDLARSLLQVRSDLPIVICSGFGVPDTEHQVEQSAVQVFLAKPYRLQELAHAVDRALHSSRVG